MDKFLDTCTLPSLKQEEVETLNRPIIRAEVEAAINSHQPKKAQVQMGLQLNSTRHKRGAGTILLKLFQTIQNEGILPKSFYETDIILIPKPSRDSTEKKTSG